MKIITKNSFKNNLVLILVSIIIGYFLSEIEDNNVFATETNNEYYYANIKTKKVNVRVGPGLQYPIKYIYYQENMPIIIVNKYQNWVQIQDYNNDLGWILEKFVDYGKKRYILILKDMNLYSYPDKSSDIKAKLEKNIVARISKCEKEWCKIKVQKFSGWVLRHHIWGISKNEVGKF